MSGIRDFITSSDVCTPSDGAGPSNAASSLVNALLGGRSKQQQQLHELPSVGQAGPTLAPAPFQPPSAAQAAEAAIHGDLPLVPGLAPHPSASTAADVDAFLRSQHGAAMPSPELLREFDSIYGSAAAAQLPPSSAAASHSAVRPFLQAFFHNGGAGFDAAILPPGASVNLSVPDKLRLRNRSTILARQLFADQGSAFADQQVGRLLHSLNIDPAALPAGQAGGDWDAIFHQRARRGGVALAAEHAAAAAAAAAAAGAAGVQQQQRDSRAWVDEFKNLNLDASTAATAPPPSQWAEEFSAADAGAGSSWADEFKASAQAGSAVRDRAAASSAMEQTKRLADTLAANKDPKFQNSKFLQFVSKMSRGELILEDNAVKEVPAEAAQWINDFSATQQQQQAGPSLWGEEFASFQANQHPGTAWAQEYAGERSAKGDQTDWAEQFAQGLTTDWAEEFSAQQNGAGDLASWEEEYLQELERLHSELGPRVSGQYVMAENNPFLDDLNSFEKGKELFRRGVLTEAVLALEAECQRNPGNSEAWRLLGTVQAENDDDVQAIAALNRALGADPNDLDALMSLGVSHTNELEMSEALGYLRQWIMQHPTYSTTARQSPGPPDSSQALNYVIGLYQNAAMTHSKDADVHVALGVLYNLSRRFDEAVQAFRAALAILPQDYSLWNKLGATLANSARSQEALSAYQKALDLKPNYMRAWTNMGISLANIGDYEGSARYYVRALALNRNAAAVWGYLRTSLSCAAREDLMSAADAEDLDALLKSLPLG